MAELARKTELQLDTKPKSPWIEAWVIFRRNRLAVVGLGIVIFFVLLAIFAPFIAPYGINEQDLSKRLLPPSADNWFGTDDFGRDILSRVIHGARISLWVGFFSVLGSVIIGALLV